jgi:DNA-binding MarR family transcriptional regulator
MADKINEYKLVEQQMMTMRQFFAEYFRKTINKSAVEGEVDFTFLELKGLAAFIDQDQEYTMGDLSSTLHLPLPNITSIVNKLAKKGIARRHRDPKDRRIIRVCLTEKGKNMRREFMKKRVEEVEFHMGKLSDKDRKELFNALKKATDIFKKIQFS